MRTGGEAADVGGRLQGDRHRRQLPLRQHLSALPQAHGVQARRRAPFSQNSRVLGLDVRIEIFTLKADLLGLP